MKTNFPLNIFIFLCLLSILLWPCVASANCGRTIISKQNGEFSNASTWENGALPASCDKIIIRHKVTLGGELWIGNNGKGELSIQVEGSLTGNGKIFLVANGSVLQVAGTLEIPELNFGMNGNSNTDSAFFVNSGTVKLTAASFGRGAIRNAGKLLMSLGNPAILNNITFKNEVKGEVTFRSALHVNSAAAVSNKGALVIQSTNSDALNINTGSFYNCGTLQVSGTLNVASGSNANKPNLLQNYGLVSAGNVYLNNRSTLDNWGRVYCATTFTNTQGTVNNYICGYIEQSSGSSWFTNQNSGTKLLNDGFIKINGHFKNIAQAKVSGSGQLYIYGWSSNTDRAELTGSLCIYDPSARQNGQLVDENTNQAKIDATVNACGSDKEPELCPVVGCCEVPTVQLVAPDTIKSMSNDIYLIQVQSVQENTTYVFSFGQGFVLLEQGKGFIKVQAVFAKGQTEKEHIINVKATNACGEATGSVKLYVINAPAEPMPVEMTSFKGIYQQNAVELTWSTASEKNNQLFEVERSGNGKDFVKIGEVKGNGTSLVSHEYAFTDLRPVAGTNYYRLKQIDTDGSFEYSKLLAVEAKGAVLQAALIKAMAYPNPTDGKVTVQWKTAGEGETTLSVYSTRGVLLKTLTCTQLEIAVPLQDYPAGLYLLHLQQPGARAQTLQVLKR